MFLRLFSQYRGRTDGWARPILLSMGLLDELITGIPVVALPLLRDRLQLSYAQIGFLFTIPAIAGLLIEPCINLLSDQREKKPWILWGLLLLAVGYAFIGNANNYLLLLLAFTVSYPAGEAGVDLSQAVVIDAAPSEGTRTMTRWTLLSSIGDFLAPLVVSGFIALHLGWTALCWLAAALWLLPAVLLAPLRFPAANSKAEKIDEEADDPGIWASVREALHDPLLLRWSALSIIPDMLDEVFLSFVVLYMRDSLHLGETLIALIVGLQMLASFAGLLLLEYILKHHRYSSTRLLLWLSLTTLAGVIGLLCIHTLWMVIVSLLIINVSAAGWYPLAKAEAYAQRPERSGVVRVIIGLGHPFDMILPGAIGLISSSFGILAGLGVLGLAPILMLILLPYRRD